MQPKAPPVEARERSSETCAVFLSYSRKDQAFVQDLHVALLRREIKSWVDWNDITVLSPDWLEEVRHAIEAADNFIFVISPDALNSAHCQLELQHAIANKKRLAPVQCREVSGDLVEGMPEALRRPSWIVPLKGDVDQIADQLDMAMRTDYHFVREHARLLIQSHDWVARGERSDLLLRGSALRDAEKWLRKSKVIPQPSPTVNQMRLIRQSVAQRSTRQRIYLGIALLAAVFIGSWLWMQTAAYHIYRVLGDAQALVELATDDAVADWRTALIAFGSFNVTPQVILRAHDPAVSGAPQSRIARALFEAHQAELGIKVMEDIVGAHTVTTRVFFPPEIPTQIVIPNDVADARQFRKSLGPPLRSRETDYEDQLWSAKDLLDKHDLPFAHHVFDEALQTMRQIPNRITCVAALATVADLVKAWPPEFRESAVYAAEMEAESSGDEFIVNPIWLDMAHAAVAAHKEDRARALLSEEIGAAKQIKNGYVKAAALITLIEPLHLVKDPAEEATTQEAIAAVREIPTENMRAASVTHLAAALDRAQRRSQASELISLESKDTPPVISLETSLAESRIAEAWAAIGNSKKSRDHLVRAVYVAQSLREPLFQSIAYSAAGLSAARVQDRSAAFFSCERAYWAASSLNSTIEKDFAYARVVLLLAQLHDVSDIRMQVMSDSIRKVSDESQIELTERITGDLLRKGTEVPSLLLPSGALKYSVSADTLADLGHRDEARTAAGLSEFELSEHPADDHYESRVRMHLAIAYARLGEIPRAVETANRCRSSSDRLAAFAGIVKAYAPKRWFGFRIWSGI
ncbi:MAG TPA: toll/interleukin-1 receptor domain-containing protein [candidate division Zixibacteria bacterium]|nr:toll/interleukin-1 receptor domain-containing protein [candidate division Zixibacteria bacterium]